MTNLLRRPFSDVPSPADLFQRTFSNGTSFANLLRRTFSVEPSMSNLLHRTFYVGPSLADLLQRIFSDEPSSTTLLPQTFSRNLLAGPLSITSTLRAVNSGDASYDRSHSNHINPSCRQFWRFFQRPQIYPSD